MFLTFLSWLNRSGVSVRKIANYLCPPPSPSPRSFLPEDFLPACEEGNYEAVKSLINADVDVKKGLLVVSRYGHLNLAPILISAGANNLDEALKEACITNRYAMAEFLVQKGAKTVEGLKVAKSPNIMRMLYRYEQNSENIN